MKEKPKNEETENKYQIKKQPRYQLHDNDFSKLSFVQFSTELRWLAGWLDCLARYTCTLYHRRTSYFSLIIHTHTHTLKER